MTEPELIEPDPATDGREEVSENQLPLPSETEVADGIDLDREYRDRAIADLEDEDE